jgi:Fe2+ transport system protein B
MELGAPLIMCLSMVDIAEHNGIVIDNTAFKFAFGVCSIPLVLNKRMMFPEYWKK